MCNSGISLNALSSPSTLTYRFTEVFALALDGSGGRGIRAEVWARANGRLPLRNLHISHIHTQKAAIIDEAIFSPPDMAHTFLPLRAPFRSPRWPLGMDCWRSDSRKGPHECSNHRFSSSRGRLRTADRYMC